MTCGDDEGTGDSLTSGTFRHARETAAGPLEAWAGGPDPPGGCRYDVCLNARKRGGHNRPSKSAPEAGWWSGEVLTKTIDSGARRP